MKFRNSCCVRSPPTVAISPTSASTENAKSPGTNTNTNTSNSDSKKVSNASTSHDYDDTSSTASNVAHDLRGDLYFVNTTDDTDDDGENKIEEGFKFKQQHSNDGGGHGNGSGNVSGGDLASTNDDDDDGEGEDEIFSVRNRGFGHEFNTTNGTSNTLSKILETIHQSVSGGGRYEKAADAQKVRDNRNKWRERIYSRSSKIYNKIDIDFYEGNDHGGTGGGPGGTGGTGDNANTTAVFSRRKVQKSTLLTENAKRAIIDFSLHLQILDIEYLDQNGFSRLLDAIGYNYNRSRNKIQGQGQGQKGREHKNHDEEQSSFSSDSRSRKCQLLFEELVIDLCEAHGISNKHVDSSKVQITVEDMCVMYSSWEPYSLLDKDEGNAGDRLLKFVDKLIKDVNDGNGNRNRNTVKNKKNSNSTSSTDFLTVREVTQVMKKLLAVQNISAGALDGGVKNAFTFDRNGLISKRDFKTALLKLESKGNYEGMNKILSSSSSAAADSNDNDNDNINKGGFASGQQLPYGINHFSLEPTLTPRDTFVKELETFALNHSATNHPFLQSIAAASFGKEKTADYLLRFISAYSKVNQGFIPSVTKLIRLLDDPKHQAILEENLEEEMGIYDEETLKQVETQFGVKREVIMNITHRELFQTLLSRLEKIMKVSYRDLIPDDVVKPYLDAMASISTDKIGLSASLYFGSEIIVPKFYSYILEGLRKSIDITNEDAIFFILHIDMDADHADHMRQMIVDFSSTYENRLKLVKVTDSILRARASVYDALVREIHVNSQLNVIPGGQCGTRAEDHPIMKILEKNLGPNVFQNSTVLEIGCACGGLLSMAASRMGAQKVVCIEENQQLIDANRAKNIAGQYFLRGNVLNCSAILEANSTEINMMPGYQFDQGAFDLAYSNQTISALSFYETQSAFQNIYKALKPDGHFIFTTSNIPVQNNDGKQLKTFECYASALKIGFSIVDIVETWSNQGNEHTLVIHLHKPPISAKGNISSVTSLDVLPKCLIWSTITKENFAKFVTIAIPKKVNQELVNATLQCYRQGLRVDDIVFGKHVYPDDLRNLQSFCKDVRYRIMYELGAVLLRGLDMDSLCGNDRKNIEMLTECSRISYYILSSFIGKVDGGARGKLFDVKDANINALDKVKGDNVLFSVSNSECSWHTDGASIDRVYDIVGLMCIFPASEGGEFFVSNACNAHSELQKKIPEFLRWEYERPLPRDILENGKGKGVRNIASLLSRSRDILAMRIRYNAYPIYTIDGDRMRFRYMRHWIETGHEKTNWRVPTFLKIAMDLLDDQLDEECCFNQRLNSGEIMFGNNSLLAHARSSFKDNEKDAPRRHLLRAWIQVQKMRLMRRASLL